MGDFKDKYGKTRIGIMLENLGKSDLLDKAGSIIKNVASGNYVNALKEVISKDDDINQDDKDLLLSKLETDRHELTQITQRWTSDNQSDSWLSKNARPLTLISLLITFFTMMFLDSFTKIQFEVKAMYVDVFDMMLITVIVAYFGSRGIKHLDERRQKNGHEPLKINPFERLKK